jgi:hypothetical protein
MDGGVLQQMIVFTSQARRYFSVVVVQEIEQTTLN